MGYHFSEKDLIRLEQAERLKRISEEQGIFYCTADDSRYPAALKLLERVPPVIYYKGDISKVNDRKNIAVIGSRQASEQGIRLSYETGKLVADKQMNLVNGLALGCDTESMKGALSAGGTCVAVMPCGLEQVQPPSNRRLAEQILKAGGCLISEYPIGTGAEKYRYVERDRLQSGISQAVLIVEAMEKSGTMHTADFAWKQKKRLVCYYYKLLEAASGNQYLEDSKRAGILKSMDDTVNFLDSVYNEASSERYEQMVLEF